MNFLKKFKNIIVTGPQRSGTRIGSKIIAYETGYKFIDEKDFGFHNIITFERYLKSDEKVVLHSPAMMYLIHNYNFSDTIIIVMIRSIDDIIASEERIKWDDCSKKCELKKYEKKTGLPSKIKYEYFFNKQKHLIKNLLLLNYNDLISHPLFLPKEERVNFKWDQTKK